MKIPLLRVVMAAAVVGLASLALSAPATAKPAADTAPALSTSMPDVASITAMVNARFPKPGMVTSAQRQAKLTPEGGASRAAATIDCTAESNVVRATIPGTQFFEAVGTATTTCPAPIDYVSAQAYLFIFVPDLNRYQRVATGSLDYETTPALTATSVASANCQAAEYLVYGYHVVRLGTQTVTGGTFGEGAGAFLCL